MKLHKKEIYLLIKFWMNNLITYCDTSGDSLTSAELFRVTTQLNELATELEKIEKNNE